VKKVKLGDLVERVRKNMAARTAGVTAQMAQETVDDVLDGLSGVSWDGQGPAQDLEGLWEGMVH
jgi:hypothetical protein